MVEFGACSQKDLESQADVRTERVAQDKIDPCIVLLRLQAPHSLFMRCLPELSSLLGELSCCFVDH